MLTTLLLAVALFQQSDTSIVGSYRTDGDFQIAIRQYDFGKQGKRLMFLDYETGRFGSFLPGAGPNFKAGPGVLVDMPTVTTMRVERDAARRVKAIWFSNNDEDPRRAVREHKYTEREVRFKSGDAELTGTLRVPTTAGSHPAVVIVHDSGAQTREGDLAYLGFIADLFASNGIASFSYDKRKSSKLDELAADAAQAMATVEQQTGIDASKVGIWGIGEGGLVVPMAVQRHGKAKFVILQSAPVRSSAGDSLAALQSIRAPVLAFFGAKDSIVPATDNAALMQSTLRGAGNRDVQIVTLPDANHLLQRAVTGSSTESTSLGKFVFGYFDRMMQWVLGKTAR
jgi:dienelactone hydrolase